MPNYRRAYVPGGTFFFTLVTYNRRPILDTDLARKILREAIEKCRNDHPFEMNACVLLPDHLHAIWTLPQGDTNYSNRWRKIKADFTRNYLESGGQESSMTDSENSEGRRGVWQPRFWEHTIQDEDDFERHFDYVHFNPVKHNLVQYPYQWKWSTFHQWVEKGVYEKAWACGGDQNFSDIEGSVGE